MHYKFHKIDDIDNKKCFLLTKLEWFLKDHVTQANVLFKKKTYI